MAGKKGLAKPSGGEVLIDPSREDSLLINCACLDLSGERHQAIKDLLGGKLNWDLLIQKAIWHRLLPLVSHHLISPDLSMSVPGLVLEEMKNLQYHSLARNLVLQKELSCLLSELNKRGIPVIVLKGAALLENIYGDISLRPMNDLDILVRPEHLDLAEDIALRRGYAYSTTRNAPDQTRKSGRHLDNLTLHEKGVLLEIHQHIVDAGDPYHFDLDGFWSRAEPMTISGVRALTLAPGDLLIHLSIKFLLDRRYRSNRALGQLCDISEVIGHYRHSLDWDVIEKTSREKGLLRGLHFVLYTCQQLLQSVVPGPVLMRFQPRDFDPASASLFIRRRVLDIRPWLAHGLVDSRMDFSRRRMFQAIVGRFSHFTRQVVKKSENGGGARSRWRRIGDILPQLSRVLVRPDELKDDLRLDRWLHDLYKSG
jgi:hypothetical protein